MEHMIIMESPIGKLWIVEDGKGISGVLFRGERVPESAVLEETDRLSEAKKQLEEYFSGLRRTFTLPLSLHGTQFQKEDWAALCTIPYGETRSYQQIANQIGRPLACRAVGMANHSNPVSIIVPCHRVIGKNGSMTGYGGGIDIKVMLLELEQKVLQNK